MSSAKASLAPLKQSPRRFGSRASAYAVGDSAGRYTSEQLLWSIASLENGGSWTYPCRKPPRARYISLSAASPLLPRLCLQAGEAKAGPEGPIIR